MQTVARENKLRKAEQDKLKKEKKKKKKKKVKKVVGVGSAMGKKIKSKTKAIGGTTASSTLGGKQNPPKSLANSRIRFPQLPLKSNIGGNTGKTSASIGGLTKTGNQGASIGIKNSGKSKTSSNKTTTVRQGNNKRGGKTKTQGSVSDTPSKTDPSRKRPRTLSASSARPQTSQSTAEGEHQEGDRQEEEFTIITGSTSLSYCWDSLGLGTRLGSAALNDFLAKQDIPIKPKLTPRQVLQVMHGMRMKTILPPEGSKLHQVVLKVRVGSVAACFVCETKRRNPLT